MQEIRALAIICLSSTVATIPVFLIKKNQPALQVKISRDTFMTTPGAHNCLSRELLSYSRIWEKMIE